MIINSLLDTDFYKLTMMQLVYHKHPFIQVEYAFKWRNWDKIKNTLNIETFIEKLNIEIDHFCMLTFSTNELDFLYSTNKFKLDFLDFLRTFKLNRNDINIYNENNELKIRIKGSWLNTILFEVPVLSIISELYTNNSSMISENWIDEANIRIIETFKYLNKNISSHNTFHFSDFCTRRRSCYKWHETLLRFINMSPDRNKYFIGTSNIYFAWKLNLQLVGTMAHEFLQAFQALTNNPIDGQKIALQEWQDEYRGELGIALSDVLGFDMFLKDFDRYFAMLYDGCRHDSGNPVEWGKKLIQHYKNLRIDPKTKIAVFSDGLDFKTAMRLYYIFKYRINTIFCIGTQFGNDCGFIAPQIVIKMVKCNELPVAKISDDEGKGMCEDNEYLNKLKLEIKVKLRQH